MRTFFLALAHAAIGGFASGYLAHAAGGANSHAVLAAAGGSALTSVLSLFCTSPTQSQLPNAPSQSQQ